MSSTGQMYLNLSGRLRGILLTIENLNKKYCTYIIHKSGTNDRNMKNYNFRKIMLRAKTLFRMPNEFRELTYNSCKNELKFLIQNCFYNYILFHNK